MLSIAGSLASLFTSATAVLEVAFFTTGWLPPPPGSRSAVSWPASPSASANRSQLVKRNDTLGQRIGSPIGESKDSFVEPGKEESKVPCTLLDIQSPTLEVTVIVHRTEQLVIRSEDCA